MTLPSAPTNLTESYNASGPSVTLNWTGSGLSVTDYAVDVSTNGGATWTTETASLGSGTTSYTDSAPEHDRPGIPRAARSTARIHRWQTW